MSTLKSTNDNVVAILRNFKQTVEALEKCGDEMQRVRGYMGLVALTSQLQELAFLIMSTDKKSEIKEALEYFDQQLENMEDDLAFTKTGFNGGTKGEA
jgi:hypothetical protein